MATRKKAKAGNDHDRKVRQVADAAKARGRRNVRADLSGYPKPKPLGGKIPDVTWDQPGGGMAVREIDPPGRMTERDKNQDQRLRQKAKEKGFDYRRLKYKPTKKKR